MFWFKIPIFDKVKISDDDFLAARNSPFTALGFKFYIKHRQKLREINQQWN